MNYSDLAIDETLKRAVADMGYTTLTPIQEKAIPVVLSGRDVMGAAQTGTGKTAAFSLPILHKLLPDANPSMSPARHPVRALILAPTRELADQVANNVKQYARHTQLRSAVVFGGVDMNPQTDELRRGVEVLIATPGRLLDHIEAKNTSLAQVRYVVLDEADRMLDIGFLPDLQRILSYLPKERTTLLFSATFSPEIKKLAASYLQDPLLVEVARPNATAATVEQLMYEADGTDKRKALYGVIKQHNIEQAIIFVNSKLGAARLARSLVRDGFKASAMHGDKSQQERLATLDAFKSGEVKLLVATDVAARGLDIAEMPAVVNYDIPFNAEDYVHRIGRTGRAGASGLAVSLVAREDARSVADIEKLIKRKFELQRVEAQEEPVRRPRRSEDDEVGVAREVRMSRMSRDRGSVSRSVAQNYDPFFDKPYEADPNAKPTWEIAVPLPSSGRSISSNIRSKRKVAALLGGKR
jgi:superfamily II DNA/RNA helicase